MLQSGLRTSFQCAVFLRDAGNHALSLAIPGMPDGDGESFELRGTTITLLSTANTKGAEPLLTSCRSKEQQQMGQRIAFVRVLEWPFRANKDSIK